MKKVLLTSVAVLAAAAFAVPAFAEGGINGGANTPGAYDSREAYENQTEFVSARTVEEYLNGHMAEIQAEAAADPAVVAAKAEFDAVEGGSHLYGEKKAAYDAAFNTAFLNVRNKYVQQFQNVQNTAKKAEGNYYILNETPEQKNARYEAEHGVKPADDKAADDKTAPSEEQKEAAKKDAEKAKAAEAKTKAAAKDAKKALPKTHAAK